MNTPDKSREIIRSFLNNEIIVTQKQATIEDEKNKKIKKETLEFKTILDRIDLIISAVRSLSITNDDSLRSIGVLKQITPPYMPNISENTSFELYLTQGAKKAEFESSLIKEGLETLSELKLANKSSRKTMAILGIILIVVTICAISSSIIRKKASKNNSESTQTAMVLTATQSSLDVQATSLVQSTMISATQQAPIEAAHHEGAYKMVWSPDGKSFISFSGPSLILWDTSQIPWKKIFVLDNIQNLEGGGDIALSPDGKLLGILSENSIDILELPGGNIIKKISINNRFPGDIAWSPNGKYLAATNYASCGVSECAEIKLFNTDNWEVNWVSDTLGNSPLSWSPDSSMIASPGPGPNGIVILNAINGNLVKNFVWTDYTPLVSWAPDGKWIWAGDDKLIDTADWSIRTDIIYAEFGVSWSPDGEKVIEYLNGSNTLYNFQTKKRMNLSGAELFDWSPDGSKIAGISRGVIKIWNTEFLP